MATITKKLAPYDYTLTSERGKPGATVFNLAPLNGFDQIACWQEVTRNADGFRISGDGVRKVIAAGLKGWRNMRDHMGNDVPYSADMVELLPPSDLNDLAWEILTNATLQAEEVKN